MLVDKSYPFPVSSKFNASKFGPSSVLSFKDLSRDVAFRPFFERSSSEQSSSTFYCFIFKPPIIPKVKNANGVIKLHWGLAFGEIQEKSGCFCQKGKRKLNFNRSTIKDCFRILKDSSQVEEAVSAACFRTLFNASDSSGIILPYLCQSAIRAIGNELWDFIGKRTDGGSLL